MKFTKGESGNKNGRPVGSLNRLNAVKKQLQELLGNALLSELEPETLKQTLKTANASTRLRFIENSLKYLIPAMTLESELDEIILQLENIKNDKAKQN